MAFRGARQPFESRGVGAAFSLNGVAVEVLFAHRKRQPDTACILQLAADVYSAPAGKIPPERWFFSSRDRR
jgi:hypothetical protein